MALPVVREGVPVREGPIADAIAYVAIVFLLPVLILMARRSRGR